MRITFFKNIKAFIPRETELDKIVCMMRSSQELLVRTQIYRWNLISMSKKDMKTMKIANIPDFVPYAIFYGGKGGGMLLG